MRSTLRSYALGTTDPAEVLGRLDRKMHHFEPDALATVLYAVFDPGLGQMNACLAGHFPPVIACPGRPAVLADVGNRMPVSHRKCPGWLPGAGDEVEFCPEDPVAGAGCPF